MTLYFTVKYLHVLGATVILGTGTGIAFFMLMAHLAPGAETAARRGLQSRRRQPLPDFREV